MSDPLEKLDSFDPGGPTHPPSAAWVRERGDRLRRRNTALVATAAAVAVVAVVVPTLTLGGGQDRSLDPAGPTPSVVERTEDPGFVDPDQIPASIDLTVGLPEENEDTSPVSQVTLDEPLVPLELCGAALAPFGDEVDTLGATYGGVEDYRARDLRLYADVATAADRLDRIATGTARCQERLADDNPDLVLDDPRVGDASLLVDVPVLQDGIVIAGTIWEVVQVGPALLLTTAEGEGAPGGSRAARASYVAEQASAVDQLCGFSTDGCVGTASPGPGTSEAPTGGGEVRTDFPLAAGWPDPADEEAVLQGPRAELPGDGFSFDYSACGESLSTGSRTGRLRATLTGPAEARTRELLTFADAADAVAFTGRAVTLYTGCGQETRDDGFTYTNQVRETAVGGRSFAVATTQQVAGSPGAYVEITHVIRNGRAVLIDTRTTEALGTEQNVDDRLEQQTSAVVPVVDQMCEFTEAGCA